MSMSTFNCYHVLIALRSVIRLESFRDCLVEEGFQVTLANSGLSCLTCVRDVVPDVLIVERDLLWGGGDGVLARLEEEPKIPKVPLILLSGFSRSAYSASPILANRGHLSADTRPNELPEMIRRYFSQLGSTSGYRETWPAFVSSASEH